MKKCFICQKELKRYDSNHPYRCAKKNNLFLKKEDIRYNFIKFNFPSISEKSTLINEYIDNLKSLPDLKKKYGIDFKSIIFLLNYFDIKKRGISESAIKISVKKSRITYQNKYGVGWVSQDNSIKEKKRSTFLKHYGVDNIRKYKKFYEYINEVMIKKYGVSTSEFHSIHSRNIWKNLSDERKNEWLNNSIHKDDALRKAIGYNKSKLESKIAEMLDDSGIEYQSNFLIRYGKNKRFFYDFMLVNFNILIEVNGDYWHANPTLYNENDIIHYKKFGYITAKDVWAKDAFKKEVAKNNKYEIIYIWEKEINNLKYNDNKLKILLMERVKNLYANS